MAEETPVDAPPEATEQAERSQPAETNAGEAEKATSSEDKPAENANAPDTKAPEGDAEKAASADEPAETKDEGDAAAAPESGDAPAANGTPASAKKASKNRRRSSGVGEKKLNRKKSQPRITNLNVKPGEYYLARLRSWAPWPSIVCDEEMLPQSLRDTRPITAMQGDGTYREDYADNGKRAHDRTFPVMFFESNEFAWVPNTQLTPLDPAECKDVSEKNKTKKLYSAYQIAAEAHDLKYFKGLLADHQAAIQQELEEEEAKEAEEAAKAAEKEAAKAEKGAKKPKRKSKAAETDVEMEDVDDSKKTKATPKKRKKEAETDGETEKPAKTAKTGSPKIKLTNKKAPADEGAKQTPASKAKKGGSKKSKAPASDEETKEAKKPEKQVDPEELKKKKEKEVLFLRHKLQKGFISRDQPPKEDEMATMGTFFDRLENHFDLEVSIIRSTKINKVLKMIVKLNSIPRDEEFNFRHRAMDILSKWKNVMDSETPSGSAQAQPDVNGTAKDDDAAETPKLDNEEEKEAENKAATEDSPMPDADLDKTEPEEAEKEAEKETEKEAEKAAPEDKPADQPVEQKPAEEKTAEASA